MMKTRPLKANMLINLLGAAVRLVVGLITVPIYVHHIGEARYGVMSIVWVLLGYFGFLDLGLSRAAANAMSKLRDAPQEKRAQVLVTTLLLNLGLGLLGSLGVLGFASYLLQHFINVPDLLKPEIAQGMPWIICLFPLVLASGVGFGALESRERFFLANVLQVIGMTLTQIAPVIVAIFISPSLGLVIPAAAMAQAFSAGIVLIVVFRKEGPLRITAFDRGKARSLLTYGGWVTVSNILGPILASLDQLVVGSLLGVAAVTHYVVPMSLVIRSQILPTALARTLFPRMSISSRTDARNMAARALVSLSYAYGAMCAPAIVLAGPFLRVWIGVDFGTVAAPAAEVLFIGAWFNGLAFVPYALLQSQGRPSITGKLHMTEVLPFIGLLWWLTLNFGIVGAAAAWSTRCAADAICLMWFARLPAKDVLRASLPIILLGGAVVCARMVESTPEEAFAIGAAMGLAGCVLAYFMAEDLGGLASAAKARVMNLRTMAAGSGRARPGIDREVGSQPPRAS